MSFNFVYDRTVKETVATTNANTRKARPPRASLSDASKEYDSPSGGRPAGDFRNCSIAASGYTEMVDMIVAAIVNDHGHEEEEEEAQIITQSPLHFQTLGVCSDT